MPLALNEPTMPTRNKRQARTVRRPMKHLTHAAALSMVTLFLLWTPPTSAQSDAGQGPTSEREPTVLHDEISRMDNALSETFNAHDLKAVMRLFAEDLEFYHDSDGLLTYAEVTEGFRRLFSADNGIRRDLVPGSLVVHPVADYGAIQIGEHRFCHKENERDDCGTFQFVHVWRKVGDQWKLARVLSYGH